MFEANSGHSWVAGQWQQTSKNYDANLGVGVLTLDERNSC